MRRSLAIGYKLSFFPKRTHGAVIFVRSTNVRKARTVDWELKWSHFFVLQQTQKTPKCSLKDISEGYLGKLQVFKSGKTRWVRCEMPFIIFVAKVKINYELFITNCNWLKLWVFLVSQILDCYLVVFRWMSLWERRVDFSK